MAVLITGGAGFVGLNVAGALADRGDSVVLFGPTPPPRGPLTWLQNKPGRVDVVTGDVTNSQDLDNVIEQHAIDRTIHGAAITADIHREKRAARDIFTVNVLGTIEMLEAALRHKLRRVVQLGTGSIFGAAGRASPALDEQTSPAIPETMYGISKYAAERTGLRYRTTRDLNLTVVRLGTVFGPWEYDTGARDTLSVPLQLLGVAERGESAVVNVSSGGDWVYVTDVARGLTAMLDLPTSPDPVYHLSAGLVWSVEDWCARLKGRFPKFSYRLTDRAEECTVGRNNAAPRSPMLIERMRRDVAYTPEFLPERAFSDYLAWRAGSAGSAAAHAQ
jgi:nucleoside-diphosphate-sugar epimerase